MTSAIKKFWRVWSETFFFYFEANNWFSGGGSGPKRWADIPTLNFFNGIALTGTFKNLLIVVPNEGNQSAIGDNLGCPVFKLVKFK